MFGPLLFTAAGRIRTTNIAPDVFNAGVGTKAGRLSYASSPPTVFHSGIGFTANGSLAAVAGAPTGAVNGVPVVLATGRVAISESDPVAFSNGLPIAANGALAVGAPEVGLFAFSDGFSAGFA